jgi:hypothetical protein
MTEVWLRVILIIFGSTMGSTGFWVFLRSKDSRRNATTRLMMGLAYVQITTIGLQYIDRGSVTKDEYEDLDTYFYQPYVALGGNGTAKRIMQEVQRLPLRPHEFHTEIFRNREEGWVNNVRVVSRGRQEASPE